MDEEDLEELSWGVAFPLPYRVLTLAGLGILAWATNVHVLQLLGIDVATGMGLQPDVHSSSRHPTTYRTPGDARLIYEAAYRIFARYSIWCLISWALFRLATRGSAQEVDVYGYIPGLTALAVLVALFCPWNILYRSERRKFILFVPSCY